MELTVSLAELNSLDQVAEVCQNCQNCRLAAGRQQVVFGEGNPAAKLMLIGEGPGAEEDRQGRPFVGAAGQLLDKILAAAGFKREEVYIANTVKCRPPGNRIPKKDETDSCWPYLEKQISLIKPKVIVCLGAVAAQTVIHQDIRITQYRGVWFEKGGIRIMPTYHPAALLRDQAKKRPVWVDFQNIRDYYATIR